MNRDFIDNIYRTIEIGDKDIVNKLRDELTKSKSSNLKWLIGISITLIGIFSASVIYFHGDLKSDLKEAKSEINEKFDLIQNDMRDINFKFEGLESTQDSLLRSK